MQHSAAFMHAQINAATCRVWGLARHNLTDPPPKTKPFQGVTCIDVRAIYATSAFATVPAYTDLVNGTLLPATTAFTEKVCLFKFARQAAATIKFDMCTTGQCGFDGVARAGLGDGVRGLPTTQCMCLRAGVAGLPCYQQQPP
jgi:hypothetical protein